MEGKKMSIKRKDFDSGNFKRRFTKGSHPVALLLQKNKSLAFRADEIGKRTKMNEDTVRSMLGHLNKEGKILHKTPYYAWKERPRARKKKVKRTKKKKKR